ncbi:hypothetical protein K435DRAFT_396152 [Dendrothele bispora CBS 962.96]|uniref:Uncharacterized protein n=1 Tax=Dendrothele bispora (strain CBS 962.96) TaxID=1314807 RepID=A0A4S8L8Z8_DENBC|nr:hypothetical protein K435DRAFT_396152 [Dendrothele bispora CBS 962.96]
MSSASLLKTTRISVASPKRAGTNLNTPTSASSPRSILKRPPPLSLSPSDKKPLSPLVFSANLKVFVTPTGTSPSAPKANQKTRQARNLTVTVTSPTSPHVHFPPSAHLTSTFVAHSSECYDRSAIQISPNPLEIPSWGTRVYSPTTGNFRGSEGGKRADVTETKDDIVEGMDGLNGRRFGTPKGSPFTPPILFTSSLIGATSPLSQSFTRVPFSPQPTKTRASIRFRNITALNSLDSLEPLRPVASSDRNNGSRLSVPFPRSPYPTGIVTSPVPTSTETEDYDVEIQVHEVDVLPLSPLPTAPISSSSTPRNRSWLMSPSPKDPFAAFPSFSLVLEEAGEL